jgi:hypothetical protein
MTHAVSAPSSTQARTPQAIPIVVLGTDALLAATPATPVQLAHACLRAGFANAIPASWGDELIAAAMLRHLPQYGNGPAIQCSCPIVAHRLLSVGGDLRGALVPLVSPPVAVARYLRALSQGTPVRITYVGRCPGATDDAIDIRMTPEALLDTLAERQIQLDEQPRVFESVIPPDRRRFRSQPGGVPTVDLLWADAGSRTLIDLESADMVAELAQLLLAGKNVLVDVAPRLGCHCSGAVAGTPAKDARVQVVALEPPRATAPVIDEQARIDLDMPIPAAPRTPVDVVAISTHAAPSSLVMPAMGGLMPNGHRISPVFGVAPVREARPPRLSNPINARAVAGAIPTARDAEGKALPRAYVARRRSSPKGFPALNLPADDEREQPVLPPRRSGGIRVAPMRLTEAPADRSDVAPAAPITSPALVTYAASVPPAAPALTPAPATPPAPAVQSLLTTRNVVIGAAVLLISVAVLTVSISAVVATIVGRSLRAPAAAAVQR